jgi:multidrug resistance efflux pump
MHSARLAVIALVVLGLGIATWYVSAQRTKEHSALSGFFESQPTDVAARITGKVAEIRVAEGDTVHRGETIVVLDASPSVHDLAAKAAAVAQAQDVLREALNGPRAQDIEQREDVVEQDRAILDKLLNGSRPQEIAQARASAAAAWESYAAAKRGPTDEEKAEARAKLDSAVAQEQLARQDADRYTRLYSVDAVTKQQFDDADENLKQASANRRDAEAALKRDLLGTPAEELAESRQQYGEARAALDLALAGSREEDIRSARATLAQAQAALSEIRAGTRPEEIAADRAAVAQAEENEASLKTDIADAAVKAPFDGTIDSVPVSQGDLISTGTPIATMEDPADIWIRVYVPESKIANVAVNSSAELRVDGIDTPVAAHVESIAAHGEFTPANLQTPEERGKQVFAVRLRLNRADSRIKAGMYATVIKIAGWEP